MFKYSKYVGEEQDMYLRSTNIITNSVRLVKHWIKVHYDSLCENHIFQDLLCKEKKSAFKKWLVKLTQQCLFSVTKRLIRETIGRKIRCQISLKYDFKMFFKKVFLKIW